ncbi:MAG TPA: hypothetical protein VF041_11755 [Gemmatimonadaceae bacterium]
MSRLVLSVLALAGALLSCRAASSGDGAASSRASSDSAATPAAPTSADSVELRADRSSYAATDTLRLTIANHAHASYSFNPCTRTVERQTASGWEALAEPDRICTMEAWLLAPDSTRNATTTLPTSIAAGTYRLALSMTREGGEAGRLTIRSEPFAVRR